MNAGWPSWSERSWPEEAIEKRATENLNTKRMREEREAEEARQEAADATSITVLVTGKTFDCRAILKASGFTWNPGLNGWVGLYSRIKGDSLPGCRVTEIDEATDRDWSENPNSAL